VVHLGPLYLRKFAAFYLGCVSCYLLQTHFQLSAVLASAAVGFLAPSLPTTPEIQAAVAIGAFAGMCSPRVMPGHLHVLIISLFGSAVYLLMRPYFKGVGGKLGFIAFVSSLLLLLARAIG